MLSEKFILLAVSFNLIILTWMAFAIYQVKKHIKNNKVKVEEKVTPL